MANARITVTRWTAERDEPDVITYVRRAAGTWHATSDRAAPPCTLGDIMFVAPDGALDVETAGTQPPSAPLLAAALPRSLEYLGSVDEIETGYEVLDRTLGSGLIQVAIDEQRWAAFPLRGGGTDAVIWLECDDDELDNFRVVPAGTTIAWASGIQDDSMTSGTFTWSIIDVGSGPVCFVADGDDGSTICVVEQRQERTNLELARAFVRWVDWEPVSKAVAHAIELGGTFNSLDSELDDEWLDGCEVSVSIDLT